jgi:prevent-host-death family protein
MRRQAKKSMADGRERRDKRASSWQVQDAKARFSELVDKALTSGPQWVTKHNRPAVVVISVEEFEKLSRTQPSESLADVLARSPYKELELDLTRKRDYGRPVDL